jgi:hypothetical protein
MVHCTHSELATFLIAPLQDLKDEEEKGEGGDETAFLHVLRVLFTTWTHAIWSSFNSKEYVGTWEQHFQMGHVSYKPLDYHGIRIASKCIQKVAFYYLQII